MREVYLERERIAAQHRREAELSRQFQYGLLDCFFRFKHYFMQHDYTKDWSFGLSDSDMKALSGCIRLTEKILDKVPLRKVEISGRRS